jgi:hypothetical protein
VQRQEKRDPRAHTGLSRTQPEQTRSQPELTRSHAPRGDV